MSFVHGKSTVLIIDGDDISRYCKKSTFERGADEHDTTHYGDENHVFNGGLGKGSSSVEGTYDNTSAGPRAVIEPLIGTVVTVVRRPEGTGTGKPQQSLEVLVGKYVETNPVDDMVMWSVDLTHSGAVTRTTQA